MAGTSDDEVDSGPGDAELLARLNEAAIDAQNTFETGIALANEVLADANALTAAACATAQVTFGLPLRAAVQQVADNLQAVFGAYQPPCCRPSLPAITPAIDAAFAGDYYTASPMTRYAAIISGAFNVRTADWVLGDTYQANHWVAQLRARDQRCMVRVMSPAQDSKTWAEPGVLQRHDRRRRG